MLNLPVLAKAFAQKVAGIFSGLGEISPRCAKNLMSLTGTNNTAYGGSAAATTPPESLNA